MLRFLCVRSSQLGDPVSNLLQVKPQLIRPVQHMWGWLNAIFNRVDPGRVKEVGPDRACAEWLLRCGAKVRWVDLNYWETDYNKLQLKGGGDKYRIAEIDCTDAAVMEIGFPHLKGLEHVQRIILHNCNYLDDSALQHLDHVTDTLEHLQISTCGDITDQGLHSLTGLRNLKTLLMYNLPEVKSKNETLSFLKTSLTSCDITFPDAETMEAPPP